MEVLIKDIRYAVRGLLKRPGFSAIVVLTLALGIGTNISIFSLINAVLLRPLPYPNPDQLIMIWGRMDTGAFDKLPASPQEFVDYRDLNHSLSAIAAYTVVGRDLTGGSDAERIDTAKVTAQFFSVLGTHPLLGRSFAIDEDQPGGDQVAILGYGLWQRRFAEASNVVGQHVILDGVSHTVVGVMPADFQFPFPEIQIWIWRSLPKILRQTGARIFSL